ncbi:MAG: monovalent cation/H+ antiporter subunit D [Planctomycetaceae bacterium]
MNHWMILPILFPAIVAPLLALAVRHDIVLARVFSVGSTAVLLMLGLFHLNMANDGITRTYQLGDWPSPFGIVLVLDRLAALMLVLTAALGLCVQLYAINGWDKRGQHFHPLFQFQLMGINGAFLTGDLFNLFVFFEVLLIASYGLLVHGGGADRMRAGLQYVTINLFGSTLFLLGLGLLYSVTGTLNMADFAVKVPEVASANQAMLSCAGMLLLIVFGLKSALFPLQFWLPGTYSQAPAPVAALFAILTKVGTYAILRIFILAFGESAGPFQWLAVPWLLPAASATLAIGMVGVLGARSLSQQASFAALGSMGLLLIGVGAFTPQSISAALYYLIQSTIGIAALFLVIDLVVARRPGEGDALTESPPFQNQGLIACLFFVVAIAVVGLPPLSGFIGKLLILDSVRSIDGGGWLWTLILSTSLLGVIGFAASGSQLFWKSKSLPGRLSPIRKVPLALPVVSIGMLVVGLVLFTFLAGPITSYLDATVAQLFDSQQYIDAVLLPTQENL